MSVQSSPVRKPIDRCRVEKLLISVVSGMLGLAVGGILLESGGVIGVLVAIPVVVMCSIAVPFLLKALG